MQLIGHDSSAIRRKAAWTFRQTNLSDYFNRPWFFITMHIVSICSLHYQRVFVWTNNGQNCYLHHYIHCKTTAFAAPFQDQSDEWSPWCHVLCTLDKCEQLQLFHQPCQKYGQCYFVYHRRISLAIQFFSLVKNIVWPIRSLIWFLSQIRIFVSVFSAFRGGHAK